MPIFQPHLTSASCENRKSGNCVFSLKCCMLFYQKHKKHIKSTTQSQLNHPRCQNDRVYAADTI